MVLYKPDCNLMIVNCQRLSHTLKFSYRGVAYEPACGVGYRIPYYTRAPRLLVRVQLAWRIDKHSFSSRSNTCEIENMCTFAIPRTRAWTKVVHVLRIYYSLLILIPVILLIASCIKTHHSQSKESRVQNLTYGMNLTFLLILTIFTADLIILGFSFSTPRSK